MKNIIAIIFSQWLKEESSFQNVHWRKFGSANNVRNKVYIKESS